MIEALSSRLLRGNVHASGSSRRVRARSAGRHGAAGWIVLAFSAAGCGPDEPTVPSPPEEVVLGEEEFCAEPIEGFSRLTEVGLERGFDAPVPPPDPAAECPVVPGAVVAEDLDGDGDVDVLLHDPRGFPRLWANDGAGRFTDRTPAAMPLRERFGRGAMGHAVVDLNDDRLPDVVVVGPSLAVVAPNLGALEFGPWEVLFDEPSHPRSCISSTAWGDVDRDGDLDLVLLGLDPAWEGGGDGPPGAAIATADRLLLQRGDGSFEPTRVFPAEGAPGLSIVAAFTDRDADGDLDLFIGSDRAAWAPVPPSAFYRNDGAAGAVPTLVNDAAEIGAALPLSAMGFFGADFDQDGVLDLCVSDIAFSLTCLQTFGGSYIETATALGLRPDYEALPDFVPDPRWIWSTWSVEHPDLDNDGLRDVLAVAGPPPPDRDGSTDEIPPWQPDAVFQGVASNRFEDRSLDVGFHDPAAHYGMAVADFEGDGSLDVVVGPAEGPPRFWTNPCGEAGWLTVELVGDSGNPRGLGARVEVTVGDRIDVQEVHGVRAIGQSPATLHFGVGDVASVDVYVRWPDGRETHAFDLPVRRRITIHPPR